MMRSLLKNRKQTETLIVSWVFISSTCSNSDRNRQKIKAVLCFILDGLLIQHHWPGFLPFKLIFYDGIPSRRNSVL